MGLSGSFLAFCQGPLNGGVSNGGVSRSGLVLPFVLCPFWDFSDFFGIFPICPGTLRGFSRFVLFLFLGLLTAGLETPRFSFSQFWGIFGHFFGSPKIRTSSTTTRDRNLQFRGAVSTGGSPMDFWLFLQYLCPIYLWRK